MSLLTHQGLLLATSGNAWETAVAALSPLVWLRLHEPSGNFIDASGNGHTGTPNNSPTRSQPAIYANMGLCAGFATTNKSVSVADHAALRLTGNLTIAVAIKRSGAVSGYPKLLWKPTDYASGRANYLLQYDASADKVVMRGTASSTSYDATSTTTFSTATPYWVVGRRSGTELSIWVNGTKEATGTLPSSGTALDTSTDSVWIGGQSATNDQWVGDLDEPMIFNYALSDGQIAALWAARA